MREIAQKEEEEARKLITSDYFPPSYEAAWNETHKKIEKNPSKNKLDLPNYTPKEGKLKNSDRLFQ